MAEESELLRATANLYYIEGLPEERVAEIVGVSRSTVSRLLLRAREKGIVRISVEEYDPRNCTLESELKSRFHLNHAIVVKAIGTGNPAEIRRTIGYFAAPIASGLIRPQAIVGVAGGRTLAELVRFMQPSTETKGVSVVQLMGNIGPSVSNIDAIELSRSLSQTFGGTFYTLNAPAFSPNLQTRDAFAYHEHIRSIWDLFRTMNIAFVGIGTLSDSAFIERGILEQADIQYLQSRGAVGEICGRFFDAQGRECISDFRDRVISIGLDDLRERKEVVAVTNGSNRVDAVRAALQGEIVKSLVIDEVGAKAILDS